MKDKKKTQNNRGGSKKEKKSQPFVKPGRPIEHVLLLARLHIIKVRKVGGQIEDQQLEDTD